MKARFNVRKRKGVWQIYKGSLSAPIDAKTEFEATQHCKRVNEKIRHHRYANLK